MTVEEIRGLLKKRPTHKWMLNNLDKIEDVEYWFEDFVPKLEAFLKNVDKALQSKDLAYKTMEKGYIQLSKDHVSKGALKKLIEEFPNWNKPIPDYEEAKLLIKAHWDWFKRLEMLGK